MKYGGHSALIAYFSAVGAADTALVLSELPSNELSDIDKSAQVAAVTLGVVATLSPGTAFYTNQAALVASEFAMTTAIVQFRADIKSGAGIAAYVGDGLEIAGDALLATGSVANNFPSATNIAKISGVMHP